MKSEVSQLNKIAVSLIKRSGSFVPPVPSQLQWYSTGRTVDSSSHASMSSSQSACVCARMIAVCLVYTLSVLYVVFKKFYQLNEQVVVFACVHSFYIRLKCLIIQLHRHYHQTVVLLLLSVYQYVSKISI